MISNIPALVILIIIALCIWYLTNRTVMPPLIKFENKEDARKCLLKMNEALAMRGILSVAEYIYIVSMFNDADDFWTSKLSAAENLNFGWYGINHLRGAYVYGRNDFGKAPAFYISLPDVVDIQWIKPLYWDCPMFDDYQLAEETAIEMRKILDLAGFVSLTDLQNNAIEHSAVDFHKNTYIGWDALPEYFDPISITNDRFVLPLPPPNKQKHHLTLALSDLDWLSYKVLNGIGEYAYGTDK